MSTDHELVQQLVNLQVPNHLRISPDGKQVVYSTQLSWGHRRGGRDVSQLWLAQIGFPGSSRRLLDSEHYDRLPDWRPDGSGIVFVSDRGNAGRSCALYVLSLRDNASPEAITSESCTRHISKWAFSPDGTQLAYTSADEASLEQNERENIVHVWDEDIAHTRLRLVNRKTLESKTLELERSVVDFCWKPDGSQIAFVHAERPDLENWLTNGVSISIVDTATLGGSKGMVKLPRYAGDLTWSSASQLFFASQVPLRSAYYGRGVYKVNPDAAQIEAMHVLGGDNDDVASISGGGGETCVLIKSGLSSEIHGINGELWYTEEREFEAFDVHIKDQDRTMCVAASDINKPVEIYSISSRDKRRTQLSSHGEALSGRLFGSCRFLRTPSRTFPDSISPQDSSPETDHHVDTIIDSLYLSPCVDVIKTAASAVEQPMHTVVLIHGGPNERHTNSFNAYYFYLAPLLLSKGYGLLIPNYRGSSGRGRNFASQVHDAIGGRDYADIIACTQDAIDQGLANEDQLLVCGYSHGGFLSFCSAVRNGMHGLSWKFKATIAGALYADADAMALSSDLGVVYPTGYLDERLIWTMDHDDTRNRRASPLWEIQKAVSQGVTTGAEIIPPILLFHGERDARCHVSQLRGVRRALQYHKLPFEAVTYPNVGHFDWEQKALIDLMLRIGRWCDKYIGHAIHNDTHDV